jgi:glycosyltransferase involved in cell wall biosynthesis
MPRVSVIIPVHNGELFIRDAIDSVLAQTYQDFEVVVADDSSSDGSADVVASFGPKVRLIRVAHGNTQATRNSAIAASSGELVGILDQDDAWQPEKLRRQLELLDAEPELGLCYTGARGIDANGRELPRSRPALTIPRDQTDALGTLLVKNIIAASSVVLRRSAFEQVGGFNPAYHLTGDWDLWIRIAEKFPIAALPEVLLDYRWHGANASRARIELLSDTVAVQEAAFARIATEQGSASEHRLQAHILRARRKLASRHSELGLSLSRAGRRKESLAELVQALSLYPWPLRFWTRLVRAWMSGARSSH